MSRKILLLYFSLFPLFCYSQVADDFSDGEFLSNPQWSGTDSKFIVENEILRLNDTQAGVSWLTTSASIGGNWHWEFWTRIAFTPSDNNHARIYLASDNADLSAPLNGYFLQIGKTGTDNKRLYFYRQEGDQITELMAGLDNIAEASNNILRIKVLLDEDGNWEFTADATGGSLFGLQGTVTDNQISVSRYFGFYCKYTVSNSNRFYFDDIYVGPEIIDTIAPQLEQIVVLSENSLLIWFSESLDPATIANVENYSVNNGIGNPASVELAQGTTDQVLLQFATSFDLGENYILSVNGVADISGNITTLSEGTFFWYKAQKYDVVFNEIMADPSPKVALPDHEYVELYNRSDYELNLDGWILQHGNTQRFLPEISFAPASYIVLTTSAGFEELQSYGENVIAIPSLSSTALTNSGTTLQLITAEGNLIDFVSYSESWYGDESKIEGGWSLERIDVSNLCEGAANWTASTDVRGGTPGEENSVAASNPDILSPQLVRVGYENPTMITLFFNESLDPAFLSDASIYTINNGIGNPVIAIPSAPENDRIQLILATPLQTGIAYEVLINGQLTDCAGNPLAVAKARFGIPESAQFNDIVINEILFNPAERGERYVELYNRSQKIVEIRDYILSSYDTIYNEFNSVRELSNDSRLLFPGEFLLVSPNGTAVQENYMTPNPQFFLDAFLPSMTNTSGVLVFASRGQQIIDQVSYNEEMHYALLTDVKGVALERVNYNRPSDESSNWHSAARNAGYGTPGYQNSQFNANIAAGTGGFEIYPKIFSPDQDGVDDLMNLSYTLNKPGYTANITVHDSRGRIIKTLYKSELLGSSGVLTWDGTTNDNLKADKGIYIVLIELFEPGGNTDIKKLTTVVGGRF